MILPLTLDGAEAVARAMRESDRREIFATRADEDPAALAAGCVAASRFGAIVACADGAPAAALGAASTWPRVWSVWMFASARWREVAWEATEWARSRLMPDVIAAGAHRASCCSIEGHRDAQAWLELLGARREGSLAKFGKNGETFHVYAWTR